MTYHLVFDATDPKSPRFIELEDSTGHSISAGEWRERKDGYVELVLPAPIRSEITLQSVPVEAAHPLAKFGSPSLAPLGLYRVHWKSGGASLAAIGMMENGDRWIAPTNWVMPAKVPSAGEWGEIERLEPIDPDALAALPTSPKPLSYEGEQL